LLRSDKDNIEELSEGGLILGAMSTMSPYEEQTITLSKGDLLVCYTDGVTEAKNESETEEYGEERLFNCIKQHRELSSNEIQDAVIDDVKSFSKDIQYDDVTIIVIKVN
jgi:sigma-B regulation protein RsbU (phosphoserine phosphatase)